MLAAVTIGATVVFAAVAVPADKASAYTATVTSDQSPADQAASFAYYKALHACLSRSFSYRNAGSPVALSVSMSQQNAIDFDWFNGLIYTSANTPTVANGINIGAFNDPRGLDGDGSRNCGDSEGRAWIGKAAALWGYSGPELLCALGFTRNSSSVACTDTSAGATNDFVAPGYAAPGNLDKLWMTTPVPASGKAPAVTGIGSSSLEVNAITPLGGLYRLYLDNFTSQCRPAASGTAYTIQEFADGSTTPTPTKYGAPDRNRGTGYTVTIYEGKQMTCGDLAAAISHDPSKGAPDNGVVFGYQKYLKANNGHDPTGTKGCLAGATLDASGQPCNPSGTSCNIPQLGWVLCPLLTTGAAMADGAYAFLSNNFLSTDLSLVNTDPSAVNSSGTKIGTGTFTAWQLMRSIGNVAFIIVFLIIIFAQLSNLGVSNYGVKKLLPRLVIAAILVNLSFLVCQVAVDLSNILGYSTKDVLEGVAKQVTAAGTVNTTTEDGNIVGIVTLVITAASLAWVNIAALVVAIVGALVALLTIFVLLIARKALIVLLIVIAPLAFVAYLLPNTEQWFHRWRKALTSMLLLFPIIGLLYGASLLASAVMKQVAGTDMVMNIAAYMVLVIPLLATIPLLKGSLDGIGKIGGAIQSFGSKARGAAESKGRKTYDNSRLGQFKKYRSGVWDRRRAGVQSGTYTARGGRANPLNWLSGANRGLNRASGRFGDRLSAQGDALGDAEDAELMKNADSKVGNIKFDGRPLSTGQLIQIASGQDVTHDGSASGRVVARRSSFDVHSRRAATQRAAAVANVAEAHRLVDASRGMGSAIERKTLAAAMRSAPSVAKAPWLGGKTLGAIEQGGISTQEAALSAIAEGKVTPEALAGGDAASVAFLVDTVNALPAGPDRAKAVAALQAAHAGFTTGDPILKAKVTAGSDHDKAIQAIRSL
ncbi:MAG: hypothetical protein JWP19_2224 [Rhodoglobus sp.]|nr:hypothetical protein [Rhodoglobus sp.]